MKLMLGLLWWFVSTHAALVIGIVAAVALIVLITAIWTPQP